MGDSPKFNHGKQIPTKVLVYSIISYAFSIILILVGVLRITVHFKVGGGYDFLITILVLLASIIFFFIARGINRGKNLARILFGVSLLPFFKFSIGEILNGQPEMWLVLVAVAFLEIEMFFSKEVREFFKNK